MRSLTLSLYIDAPSATVYSYAANPLNLPHWVPSFCKSVSQINGKWQVQTADGPVEFAFVPPNTLGVLDHSVTFASGLTLTNPMRVIANGTGCEILFTLFQHEGMTDEQFRRDAELVLGDLTTLKNLLEAGE